MKRIGSILLWSANRGGVHWARYGRRGGERGREYRPGAAVGDPVSRGIATFTLQEFAGRLSVATGDDLATVLRRRYPRGFARVATLLLVGGAGPAGLCCLRSGAIYSAGAAGAMLAIRSVEGRGDRDPGERRGLFAARRIAAGRSTAHGDLRRADGCGVPACRDFAWLLPSDRCFSGLVPTPGFADEPAALLAVLALVGTTVVPYNLFLGAALARGQSLDAMRFGLAVSVGLGVLITAAILVVGTALAGEFSFAALGDALAAQLGGWARTGFGMGLLAAGVSSAVTAPLAAALTARGLFGAADDPRWRASGWRFRSVWFAVLVIGLGFGLAAIKPTPAILAAQAFNGVLLPLVALFLLAAMNDDSLLGDKANGLAANGFGLLVVSVATMLGLTAVARAAGAVLGFALPDPGLMLPAFALLGVLAGRAITRRAQPSASTLV